jgi:hypothetical protein
MNIGSCVLFSPCWLCYWWPPRARPRDIWWPVAMEAQEQPAHGEGRDVLAVFDIGDGSKFGKLVAYVPTDIRAEMAHHTNVIMPANHRLFANDFMAAQSQIFDLTDVRRPVLAASFTESAGYTHPHSFATLSTATYSPPIKSKETPTNPARLSNSTIAEKSSKRRALRRRTSTKISDLTAFSLSNRSTASLPRARPCRRSIQRRRRASCRSGSLRSHAAQDDSAFESAAR